MKKSLSLASLAIAFTVTLSAESQAVKNFSCSCGPENKPSFSIPISDRTPIPTPQQLAAAGSNNAVMSALTNCVITCHNQYGKDSGNLTTGSYKCTGKSSDIKGLDDQEYVRPIQCAKIS